MLTVAVVSAGTAGDVGVGDVADNSTAEVGDIPICKKGGSGTFLGAPPESMSIHLARVLYLFFLLWCFVGVAIVADTFMAAIETITSQEKTVTFKGREFHVKVWNDTVANLTLMALGSSAPEILLSVIEILLNKMYSGALGPSTIVGSAAFNLMCICAVCVIVIPAGEMRKVKDTNVFAITACCSVFAYIWLVIILSGWTKNIVTPVEAILTFLFFPVLVVAAYGADKKWCRSRKQINPKVSVDAEGGVSKEETAAIIKKVKKEFGDNLSPEDFKRYAQYVSQRDHKKSRAQYRVEATRNMFGGKHPVKASPALPTATTDTPTGVIQFVNARESCAENAKEIVLLVERSKPHDKEVEVQYMTQDVMASNGHPAATADKDYKAAKDVIRFPAGKGVAEIKIEIFDDISVEQDESFEVVLFKPSSGTVGSVSTCTVTIMNDDKPGIFAFDQEAYEVREADGELKVGVVRKDGIAGDVSVKYQTVDQSAVAPADYAHTTGTLEFKSGETRKEFVIPIVEDDKWERDEKFQIHLTDATGGAGFSAETDGNAEKEIATVTIKSDDKIKTLGDLLNSMVNKDKFSIGASNWKEQFASALDPRGGDPDLEMSAMMWFGHCLSFPWKIFFAIIPPTHFAGGWACFIISLCFIGFVTAIIADLASLLGCVFGMKDSITAITFVALGTSLPDTFASKAAAIGDEYADNSIGNVTGSNSVNVFLGLGMPWLIAAIYWSSQDCEFTKTLDAGASEICMDWFNKNKASIENDKIEMSGFVVDAGDLTTSVVAFSSCAIVTLGTLVLRRRWLGGELGGPDLWKKVTAIFFVGLWFVYLAISIMVTTGAVSPI
jgi:solute carrier family 8 (sodium/calcium exchanger)